MADGEVAGFLLAAEVGVPTEAVPVLPKDTLVELRLALKTPETMAGFSEADLVMLSVLDNATDLLWVGPAGVEVAGTGKPVLPRDKDGE